MCVIGDGRCDHSGGGDRRSERGGGTSRPADCGRPYARRANSRSRPSQRDRRSGATVCGAVGARGPAMSAPRGRRSGLCGPATRADRRRSADRNGTAHLYLVTDPKRASASSPTAPRRTFRHGAPPDEWSALPLVAGRRTKILWSAVPSRMPRMRRRLTEHKYSHSRTRRRPIEDSSCTVSRVTFRREACLGGPRDVPVFAGGEFRRSAWPGALPSCRAPAWHLGRRCVGTARQAQMATTPAADGQPQNVRVSATRSCRGSAG